MGTTLHQDFMKLESSILSNERTADRQLRALSEIHKICEEAARQDLAPDLVKAIASIARRGIGIE